MIPAGNRMHRPGNLGSGSSRHQFGGPAQHHRSQEHNEFSVNADKVVASTSNVVEYVLRVLLVLSVNLDSTPNISMKRLLLHVAGCLACLTLAQAAPVEITYWDFLGGGDGIRMKQIVEEFNKSQQEVRVTQTTHLGQAILHQGSYGGRLWRDP